VVPLGADQFVRNVAQGNVELAQVANALHEWKPGELWPGALSAQSLGSKFDGAATRRVLFLLSEPTKADPWPTA
jgi:hypothetical protein